MKIGKREVVAVSYLAFAILEVVLYALSGLIAVFILPLALASALTGHGLRLGHAWTPVLAWATAVVTLIFGSSTAYASLLLGSASIIFGLAMVVFGVGAIALSVYVSLNWSKLRVVD